MDLPLIDTPIFPRWVWIEEITYSHIPIATLVTAFMVLAPIYEYVGYRRGDPRFDRLARSLVWFSLILFSPGAALGTGIPMWIMGTYPEFWSRWSNLFFWPLIAQFVFFLGEVVFLFFFYYLAWDALRDRKRLHIAFGTVAALFGLAVQFVWDALGAYMLTPSVPLPGVLQPVGWSAAAFWNPSFPFLFSHRFFGNISYAMLLTGGVFALKHWRAKADAERDYFGWGANLMFTVGFLAFFAMPFIGWGYARVIQANAPVAFHAIMGGHTGPHFTIKMGFVTALVAVGAAYFFARYRARAALGAVSVGLAALLLLLLNHPPLGWVPGGKPVWQTASAVGLLGFIAVLWFAGHRLQPAAVGAWRWFLFSAGMAAFCAFLVGGFVRERSKSPDTVYGEIVKPEVLDWEADRYLLYQRCLGCHQTPRQIEAYRGDWTERLAVERQRPGVSVSDEEAHRLVRYLEGRGR